MEFLTELKKMHAEYFPEDEPLQPRAMTCDGESAFIKASKIVFNDLEVALCAFHLKSSAIE